MSNFNLLGTILLVLPGIVALYLAKMIGPSDSKPSTDFEKTIIGLLFNIPGFLFVWGMASIRSHQKLSLLEFEAAILRMPCFIYYMILVFCVALLVALWWDKYGREYILSWIDKNREGQRPAIGSATAWEEFVGSEKEAIVRVYQIDKKECAVVGIFKASWMPGDQEKGILLTCTDQFQPWNEWLEKPIRTYVDTASKMVYEFFPPSAYEDAKRRAEEYKQQ